MVQKSHEEPFRKFSQLYKITIKWVGEEGEFLHINFLWPSFGGSCGVRNRKLFLITSGGKIFSLRENYLGGNFLNS